MSHVILTEADIQDSAMRIEVSLELDSNQKYVFAENRTYLLDYTFSNEETYNKFKNRIEQVHHLHNNEVAVFGMIKVTKRRAKDLRICFSAGSRTKVSRGSYREDKIRNIEK